MRKSSPADGAEDGEAKAVFHLRMRARGVRDLSVLRAFERVPRIRFLPERYAALATRDMPIPIACGQTSHEPWLLARAIEALAVEPHHRVLEIGSGSGYVTAVLAHLAAEVLGLERYASLADEACRALDGIGIPNATVVWGDGLAVPRDAGMFDRILIHAAVDELPGPLLDRLAADGRVVAAKSDGAEQMLTCWSAGFAPLAICPSRFAALVPGLAAVL